MTRFNPSEWALSHRSFVWYLMIVSAVAGLFAYFNLGREEDPNFAIKTMIISAQWPGATLADTVNQVTDRIERKLEELDTIDYTKSQTSPGSTVVFLNLLDTTVGDKVDDSFRRTREILTDLKAELPEGVIGPFFNDDFGDVYGNIYAFTASDGVSQRQLRDYAEDARAKILSVPDVGKVNIVGAQDELVYLEFSTAKVASLGVSQQAILDALAAQNAITPSGTIEANGERVTVRVNGQFRSEDNLRDVNLWVDGRFFRLADVASVSRAYADPPSELFRFNGEPALGLAIGMKPSANLLKFGEALETRMKGIEADLPLGISVHKVSDQPKVVDEAVGHFTTALVEAVVIVLIVSFVSLGFRAGFIITLTIPLVLAITFVAMQMLGISLQRISLGALIIALGLLVDDEMIAVEMMVARLEQGDTLKKAATYIFTSTAAPMLTGTLVTIASFMPVGLNSSGAGEYTFTLFVVIAVSLLVSWVVAILFAPLLGYTFLPKTMKKHDAEPGRFTRGFRRILLVCVRFKWLTILVTVALFVASVFGMGLIPQQFFPSSDRPEVLVDVTLHQGASITETRKEMDRLEAALKTDKDVQYWSSYVGRGAERFILSFDVPPASPNFGQIIVMTADAEARDRVIGRLKALARAEFVGTDIYARMQDIGPPIGRPLQYRVSGPDPEKVRGIARRLGSLLAANPHTGRPVYDWMEPSRVVKVDILQDRARQLGITSQSIAAVLNGIVGGSTATQIRDSIYLVNVVSRADKADRSSIETLENLQVTTANGQVFPLAAIANFEYELEQPILWRRDRIPTLTVKASVESKAQPTTLVAEIQPAVDELQAKLDPGYRIAVGGAVEESTKSQGPIQAVTPLMLLVMLTLLMMQLQSFQRMFIVIAVAPLGLIGVVAAMLPFGTPMGFVAILGVLALIGILIRNSVILVVWIEEEIAAGRDRFEAVIDATEHRMRPIMLTAAAAALALIPIARQVFWGPMAFAMMGGIVVGTLLTLLFLPALYVAWFRVKPQPKGAEPS